MKTRDGVLWSPANSGPLKHPKHAVTMHDTAVFDVPEAFSKPFRSWYEWLWPKLAHTTSVIFAPSEFSKERICERFKVAPEKVILTPNGVSPFFKRASDEDIQAMRTELSLPFPYILALGSADPRKDFAIIEKAAKAFVGKGMPEFLWVGGNAKQIFQSQDSKSAGASGPLHMRGYVADEYLPALYSGAEAFIFPSRYEGFGLPVLEAMACGTPVIASNIPPVLEVAGDAAIFFPVGNLDGLIDAIDEVFGDSAKAAVLGADGMRRSKLFTWEASAVVVRKALNTLAYS